MAINSYKDLDIWQRSINLVTDIYALTKIFPKEELYTLTSQMKRAAISVPSNIAEGHSKKSTRDYMRFLNISHGSLAELETQLIIAEKLGYVTANDNAPLLKEAQQLGKMINGLLSSLEKRLSSGSPES